MYTFNPDNPSLVVKSAGYAVYSDMFRDGVFWAPKYEIYSARFLGSYAGKTTAGDQWVCKSDHVDHFGPQFHCTAVWFHGLRHSDLTVAASDWWIGFDKFHPEYEVPSTAPRPPTKQRKA